MTTPTRSAQHPAVGTYVMAARTGSLLFVSDHGAIDGGRPATPDLLATLKAEVGDLSPSHRFERVWVNSAPHYTEQHRVADGATDLLVRTFGNRIGRPARSAVVAPDCPSGSPWKSRTSSRRRLKPAGTLVGRLTLGS